MVLCCGPLAIATVKIVLALGPKIATGDRAKMSVLPKMDVIGMEKTPTFFTCLRKAQSSQEEGDYKCGSWQSALRALHSLAC
jgi:hypothetical protein